MSFPLLFEKCPICGCMDTVYRLGVADDPSISEDTFPSMEKKVTPLQDFTKIFNPTVRVLLRHYDTCAGCGLDYCTRVDKTIMSTDTLMKLMGVGMKLPS